MVTVKKLKKIIDKTCLTLSVWLSATSSAYLYNIKLAVWLDYLLLVVLVKELGLLALHHVLVKDF